MKKELQYIKQRFNIIGNAPLLNRAIEIAMQVAATDLSVLITGESGTGKESFSKIIHALSPYRHGNFIAINCGAIPEGTIDSELFGHEKGAFTGALENRKGYFEEANGGTIFLDEIGEMPLGTQTRLLRVLEYGEYVKVGASSVQKTKVRVVAATHVDLLHAIREGKFREDLYYRLNTVPIHIPPLRERGADIIQLFHKFSSDFAAKYRTKPLEISSDAKDILHTYPFPGNIRQLKNIVEQMALLEEVVMVTPKIIEKYLPKAQSHTLPVLYKKWNDNGLLEKEYIYPILFDLKRDIAELKALMFNFMESNAIKNPIVKEHTRLCGTYHAQENKEIHFLDTAQSFKEDHVNCITASTENLSIEAQEQALIRKSLKKNNGNRKSAADDLGISERTLYRKIKQYEIEESDFKK
ncbi:MAG: sigma-54 dependent transcriptional regulator [Candidatus Cardinium sp.]|uniref:sigma-54 interaction domain-containing protein n=1 Tax=Cardinium endosymbiont of Dermatophagoides farinae TaxID=2597823 RepID=UPI0011844B0E|nr:sigma-54 dependent transcriptional regulator [Cardinium endosymbiont of Dermatophagoides farinae]TSJ80789.1 sigma-54-dependent Fis family transcriptional regulator [Cardinium endosymbiont of Dermatophagoides farinae]UWW96792.1 MAG: sigma-54 dependent transcriptional regulator [Candidatus Cardinium sp.]